MKNLLLLIFLSVSIARAQNLRTVDSLMVKHFPNDILKDGRWVYDASSSKITTIDSPIKQILPVYSFYEVVLINHLGYHVNSSECLVLIDFKKSKTLLVVPLWYGDISDKFLKLFLKKEFSDSSSLLQFAKELQTLLLVGSSGEFTSAVYSENKVTFDYLSGGKTGKDVWRNMEIILEKNKIKGFRSINPVTKEVVLVK